MKLTFAALLLVGLATGGAWFYHVRMSADDSPAFRTVSLKRDDLLITIDAMGTLEPEEVVDVGAQVAGRIKELGKELRGESDPAFKGKHVDYGSPVREKMLLAQIDDSLYRAARDSAKAQLDHDEADLVQLQAKSVQAEAEWKRAQKLRDLKFNDLALNPKSPFASVPIQGITDSDYILAKANYEVAAANVESGKAKIEQDKAALFLAQTNVEYTTINSPVDGVIIDRRVNIGQTVVASLNAPSMFLLARDLRNMQVWAPVNEADIGRLK